jgi:hypothetical protein
VDSAGWPAATPFFLCLVIFFPLHCLFCLGFRVSSLRSEYVICNWFCMVEYCGKCRCVRVNSFFIINMLQVLQLPPSLPPSPLATWFSQLPFVLISVFKSFGPFLHNFCIFLFVAEVCLTVLSFALPVFPSCYQSFFSFCTLSLLSEKLGNFPSFWSDSPFCSMSSCNQCPATEDIANNLFRFLCRVGRHLILHLTWEMVEEGSTHKT